METQFLPIVAYIVGGAGIITAVSSWIPLARFLREAKKESEDRAKAEGVRETEMRQMRTDINRAHEKIRSIDERLDEDRQTIIEMRADLKHLVAAVDKINNRLDTARPISRVK